MKLLIFFIYIFCFIDSGETGEQQTTLEDEKSNAGKTLVFDVPSNIKLDQNTNQGNIVMPREVTSILAPIKSVATLEAQTPATSSLSTSQNHQFLENSLKFTKAMVLGRRVLSNSMKQSLGRGTRCEEFKSTKAVLRIIAYLATKLPPSNLQTSFGDATDACLLETLSGNGIATSVFTGNDAIERLQMSSYGDTQQHLIIGDLTWVTSIVSLAKELYNKHQMNALKTRWLWVVWEDSVLTFPEVRKHLNSHLQEGIRGILLHIRKHQDSDSERNWSLEIASVDDQGTGFWRLLTAASWTPEGGLVESRSLWSPIPYNLKGRLLRLACVKKPSVFEWREGSGLLESEGYISEIMKEAEKKLNFTSVIIPASRFGNLLPNGSWNGAIGAISRGEADLAPIDLAPTFQRAWVVDFSLFYDTDYDVIVTQTPQIVIRPFILLQIFTPLAWFCFLCIAVVSGVALGILYILSNNLSLDKETSGLFGLYCSASLKIIVFQGSSCWFDQTTSRIIGGCMMFLSVIFFALYGGSVTAFLAIPFRSPPINSLEDLASRDVTPVLMKNSRLDKIFKGHTEGVKGEINSRLVGVAPQYLSSEQLFNDVVDGKYAALATVNKLLGSWSRFEDKGRPCLLYVGTEPFTLTYDAFAIAKNSPVRKQIDEVLRWFRSYGIIPFLKRRAFTRSCKILFSPDDKKPLSMLQGQGAFYVIFVGLTVSLFAFMLELIIKKEINYRQRTRKEKELEL